MTFPYAMTSLFMKFMRSCSNPDDKFSYDVHSGIWSGLAIFLDSFKWTK